MASSVYEVILYVVLGVFRSRGQSLRSQRPQGPINPSFLFSGFSLYSHSILSLYSASVLSLFFMFCLCLMACFPPFGCLARQIHPISLMRATLCVYCISLVARNCARPPSRSSNGQWSAVHSLGCSSVALYEKSIDFARCISIHFLFLFQLNLFPFD